MEIRSTVLEKDAVWQYERDIVWQPQIIQLFPPCRNAQLRGSRNIIHHVNQVRPTLTSVSEDLVDMGCVRVENEELGLVLSNTPWNVPG